MSITQQEIYKYIEKAKEDENATHVLIVSDTFDYSTYPVTIYKNEDIHKKIKEYDNYGKMSRVMETHILNRESK